MQIVIKNRESISAAGTFFTAPVNVSGMSLLTVALIAHAVSGTTPDMTVTPQTSDNLEDWDSLTTSLQATAASYQRQGYAASGDQYGQYLRFQIVVTGTTPFFNYSLFLNTFQSS